MNIVLLFVKTPYILFKQLNYLSLDLPVGIPAYIVYIHMGL